MAISVRCPNPDCGKPCRVRDEVAGKSVKCPECGTRLTVPPPKRGKAVAKPTDPPASEPDVAAGRTAAPAQRSRAVWPWLAGMLVMLFAGAVGGYFLAVLIAGKGENPSAKNDSKLLEQAAKNAELTKQLAAADVRLKEALATNEDLKKLHGAGLSNPPKKTDSGTLPKPPDGPVTKPKSIARTIKGVAEKELFSLDTDDPVRGIAVSPDGTFVLAGSGKPGLGGQAQCWDTKTGKALQKFTGHTGHVTCVDIAPDSKTVATASWDGLGRYGAVKWFDAQTGACRATWELTPAGVEAVAFSHDGTQIAAGSYDFKLALNPNMKQQPGCVQIWSTVTQQPTLTLRGHDFFFNSLFYTGKSLIGTDSIVLIQWNVATGQEEKRFALETLGGIGFRCCLAGDETTLAIYVEKKRGVVLLNLKTENVLWTIPAELNAKSPLVFAPDGRTLAIGDKTGVVHLWDVTAKKEIAYVKAHTEALSGLAFSPNGELLVTGAASGDKGIVRIWKCRQE